MTGIRYTDLPLASCAAWASGSKRTTWAASPQGFRQVSFLTWVGNGLGIPGLEQEVQPPSSFCATKPPCHVWYHTCPV